MLEMKDLGQKKELGVETWKCQVGKCIDKSKINRN